ncbi:MAG TPA: acyl-CoA dehydrogenase family protein [Mycobacteriales bacterium]|nr:acyl-CoA dehydrogenase family protein [Mycobacteriales bacterium]
MDLTPSPAQQALRDELRAWIAALETHPSAIARHDDLEEEVTSLRAWQQQLAAGRWVGVTWPEEYGGRGLGPVEHALVQEELARAGAPELVGRIGVNMVGPTMLAHGTPEQKARWLPHVLGATEIWCQLFSEPGAGSDLASLSTRGVRDDANGGWRLSGQKVWTSYAQFAQWGICLARTDPDAPKHRGITMLVVRMDDPGVTVRPLVQLTGEAEFNEVFLDDVFVPDDRVVGAVNNGWRVANSTLSHERGSNPRQLVIHTKLVEDLVKRASIGPAYDDPRLRQRVAQGWMEMQLFRLHSLRSLSRLASGQEPGPEGSSLKLWWSESSKRLHATGMAVLGDDAPLWGDWQRSWLYYQASSIWAGTNEIQRTVLGERVLGLPKEERA